MGDTYYTKMTIGGRLPTSDCKKLYQLIKESDLEVEDGTVAITSFRQLLQSCASGELTLEGELRGSPETQLRELFVFLGEHQLAYRIRQDGNYEVVPEIYQWLDPEHGLEVCLATYHEPAKELGALQAALKEGKSLEQVVSELARFTQPLPELTFYRKKRYPKGAGIPP